MKLAVLTSGRGPVPACMAALRHADLDLVWVHASDPATHPGMRASLGQVPLVSDFRHALDGMPPDRLLLLSWPDLVREDILARFPTLNVHNSLLPAYRGLHAFTWALLQGESQVGYTLHEAVPQVDAGPIFAQCTLPVGPDDTIVDLFRTADACLPAWLARSLADLAAGRLTPRPQDESLATRFPRRHPAQARLDFDQPAWDVHNAIRAQAPPYTPGAFAHLEGQPIILARSTWTAEPARTGIPGTMFASHEGMGFLVQCQDRPLHILEAHGYGPDGASCAFHGHPGLVLRPTP